MNSIHHVRRRSIYDAVPGGGAFIRGGSAITRLERLHSRGDGFAAERQVSGSRVPSAFSDRIRLESSLQRLVRAATIVCRGTTGTAYYRDADSSIKSVVHGVNDDSQECLDRLAEQSFVTHLATETVPASGLGFCVCSPIDLDGDCVGVLAIHIPTVDFEASSATAELRSLALIGADLIDACRRVGKLREQEHRAIDFARASGDWLWETDESDICRWVSENFEAATGFPNSRVIGKPIPDRLMLDWMGRPLKPHRTFSQEMKKRRDVRAVCLMGASTTEGRFMSISAIPRLTEGGAFAGYRGLARDVTDRVRLEAAVRGRDAAERDNRAHTEFLSRVSQELRTPLNAIIRGSHLVLARLAHLGDDELIKFVRPISAAGSRLLATVNQLLDSSKIERSHTRLELESVCVNDCIEKSLGLARVDAAFHDIGVIYSSSDSKVFVQADRTLLDQILTNLLSNAYRYNRPAGEILIELGICPDDAEKVDISIVDRGIGSSPDRMQEPFQPFSRLGAERTGISGTDRGLTMMRALAEKMRGAITITSTLDSGTRCLLRLPRGEAPTALAIGAKDSAPGCLEYEQRLALKVIYMEDDPVNQMLISEAVKSLDGVELMLASSGEEGIGLALVSDPDLVLLDMNLPDMHGSAVLAALIADPATCAIRRVALSADARPEHIARAIECGAHDYWIKPINLKQLKRNISEMRNDLKPGSSLEE